MTAFIFFIFGLVFGSFFNVCIYRIPLGKSIVFPSSFCPNCQRNLQWYELIPLLSYLIQQGKCRGCGMTISWKYPAVEMMTGLLFGLLYLHFGLSLSLIKGLILVSVLIIVSFIDLKHQIIPNVLVLPGAIVGILLNYNNIIDSLLGLTVGFCIIAAIILLSRGGMGWGDSKLLGMIGAFFGWQAAAYSLFVGSFFGAIIGVTLILLKRIDRKTPIPFGPYIALGALLWLFFPYKII